MKCYRGRGLVPSHNHSIHKLNKSTNSTNQSKNNLLLWWLMCWVEKREKRRREEERRKQTLSFNNKQLFDGAMAGQQKLCLLRSLPRYPLGAPLVSFHSCRTNSPNNSINFIVVFIACFLHSTHFTHCSILQLHSFNQLFFLLFSLLGGAIGGATAHNRRRQQRQQHQTKLTLPLIHLFIKSNKLKLF